MKFSKYNLIIKQGDTSILFNTLSGEIYSLDSRLESAVKNEDPNLLSAQATYARIAAIWNTARKNRFRCSKS